MKIVLILMVRNESKIIQRCLKAVEGIVDAFCVHDTGSTDNTCELVEEFLQTHRGCLTKSEWRDFGYNRTESFREAQKFLQGNELSQTYGLLLDGDMVFESGTLLDQILTEKGYTVIQRNGGLEYPNCRLVRMDYDWVCKGVTHEYWDGPTSSLPKSVCYIDDKNDGGCKSDKFERDARLLEKGMADEPDNVRYIFYLAQTYHCLNRHKEAIQMYKKRVNAGGWAEEQWYSLYMIGKTYMTLGNIPSFEKYMLKAFETRPNRAEPLYMLTKYFREHSLHFKSYQYMMMGMAIPYPSDSLFIEMSMTIYFTMNVLFLIIMLEQTRETVQDHLFTIL
jgi:glycosyltransferase involved in cell wall biosynthesis